MKNLVYITTMAVVLMAACVTRNKPVANSREQLIINQDMNDYADQWAEIEALRKQRLPQSMQPKVEAIYQAALAEQNYEQMLKAVIFQVNGLGLLKENDEEANLIFNTLKKDAETVPQPAKAVVYSMIGQLYEDYYNQNAWTINHRTQAVIEKEDIQTWDARSLAEEAVKYYLLSLQDKKTLQQAPMDLFGAILQPGYDVVYQPTLYDLLTKRALAYFSSGFNVHTLSQQAFVINQPDYFSDVRKFVQLDIQTADTLSPEYLSLKLYQDLLRFHLEKSGFDALFSKPNEDVAALIEADLRRVSFLRANGRYADTDKMYENALLEMSRQYKACPENVRVLLQLVDFYENEGHTWRNNKLDEKKASYTKAYKICEQIEAEYPDRQAVVVEWLKKNIQKKELDMRVEATQLPGKPFLALLKYRNIDTLYQTIYPLSEQEAIDYTYAIGRYSGRKYEDIPGFIKSLSKKPMQKHIVLPSQSDFQYYTTEIKIDPLAKGFYLILFSDTTDPVESSDAWAPVLIQTSSLMAYDRHINGVATVTVTSRETGEPLAGAAITTFRNEKKQASFVSDRNGLASAKNKSDYNNQYYTVVTKDDRLLVFNPSYDRQTYNERNYNSALMFTDRSIYRPGQTVYFKAVLYENKANVEKCLLNRASVTVRFRDTNWQVISEKKLTSNDFGSIDGYFVIPQGLLNGNMTIECGNYGSTSIRVEEYKRPTFEVKFDPIKGNFALNEQVQVTGQAHALAGYAIDHAQVQYRVVRQTMYRYYYWWFPPLHDEDREISSGVLKTDEKGSFVVDFKALADDVKDDNKIYTYRITADVTDVNGETRSSSVHVRVGNKPLLVNTNLPENVDFEKRNEYTLQTTNLNGDFTPATVRVELIELKHPGGILRDRIWKSEQIDVYAIPENEFRKDFPLDAYGDELNPIRFEEIQTVSSYELETGQETERQLDLSSLQKPGHYKIKLIADNRKGVVVENVRFVHLSGDKMVPITAMNQWIKSVKTKGEPGENAEFQIAGGFENTQVYCELIHQNKIVETKWVKTGMTPETVTYPIKEMHRGGFVVQFSMIQQNRKYTAVVPVNVPFTNKMLDVKLTTFRDQLLPGENEIWTMKVSDKEGGKALAEVAASLYDASLDAFAYHSWLGLSSVYQAAYNSYVYQWSYRAIESLVNAQTYYNTSSVTWHPVFLTDINWFGHTYRQAFYANTIRPRYSRMRTKGLVLDDEMPLMSTAAGAQMDNVVAEESEMADEMVDSKEMAKQKSSAAPNAVDKPTLAQGGATAPEMDLTAVETRTNFNETAFFYPALRTNAEGEVLIEFTIPEALTRWKLLSFAHTKDFKIGTYTNELITQKEVAISANPPRFFRENDVIELIAKVNNLTETDLNGQALLRLYDAVTMEPVDAIIQSDKTLSFEVKTGESKSLRWKLVIPEGLQAITYKVTAQAGTHTDGEEKTVPVLTNSMLVTETMPFSIRAGKEKQLTFERLVHTKSNTLRHHSLTLEYTSAPAWYAVQSLPYIMEYPYECAEQTFSRYYANSLATTIVNKTPRIKQVFDLWNQQNSEALLSNLEKNQELKQVMLEETPWVMQARNESERKKRIGLLFDLNRMSSELNRAFNKLKNAQNGNGGFPWFEGNPPSRYITQHIVAGMAHLEKLGAMQSGNAATAATMVQRGLSYLDGQIWDDYNDLVKRKANLEKCQISSIQLHYLYACSFTMHQPSGRQKEAFDYYLSQAGQFWMNFSTYEKAITALVLHRNKQTDKAMAIIRSLKEYAQQSEEMGMYWKDNVAGYFWYQAPIETQAMLIEAFNEVASDTESVEEMKIWLLRNKQTNDWKTTKATSEAIYALLMTGGNLLDESRLLEVEVAGRPLAEIAKEPIKPEPGTGYVKTSWQGSDVTPQMGQLKVKNPNNKGIAWGGMYWQYFEQLDQITSAETSLRMNKQLFLRTLTAKGEVLVPIGGVSSGETGSKAKTGSSKIGSGNGNANSGNNKSVVDKFASSKENSATSQGGAITSAAQLKVGDLVRVRMELRADRDYEYVHLKDMRAAGFEPVSTVSGHRYQDGLWYYESVKDASTNFFITYLRKGTYVFEYDLRVSHVGDFSNGITTFQCMYAPEFSAHSEGIRISVVGGK